MNIIIYISLYPFIFGLRKNIFPWSTFAHTVFSQNPPSSHGILVNLPTLVRMHTDHFINKYVLIQAQ